MQTSKMPATTQPILATDRLILRPRTMEDLDHVMAMNSDPEVMRHIAPVGNAFMSREAVAKRSFTHVDRGLGYWSISPRESPAELLGYVALFPGDPATPRIELSYRFDTRHWGRGYATEAVSRLLQHGFGPLDLAEVVILTHPLNAASLRLAQRLGFQRESDRCSWLMGDPQFLCAFFRLSRAGWLATHGAGTASAVTQPVA
ncbi:GNAT family N-acetyltransferase [Bosea sp. BIWAKO-01]|uniref:GNAT family N-acetyltransferase n=1 Tax=Bosea sp. BIWAKO-01 TaxID=506668 RepID=UPI00159F1B5F|nr:GNAT family N-acetyltransferase [Bosea sp. BIWAKO-01]